MLNFVNLKEDKEMSTDIAMEDKYIGMIPEWAEQDAVALAWPSETMDWACRIDAIRSCYIGIVQAISRFEPVILLHHPLDDPEPYFTSFNTIYPIRFVPVLMNDTWVRDYMPIACIKDGKKEVVKFRFNGWGMKYASNHDNRVAYSLFGEQGFYRSDVSVKIAEFLVTEGGALESSGDGLILATASSIFSINRNDHISDREELLKMLLSTLSAKTIRMTANGFIPGDDTDGHIDTLARFIDSNTVAYVSPLGCYDFSIKLALQQFENEIHATQIEDRDPFKLLALPYVEGLRDEDGALMPASYANFLFVNGAVLVPTYGVHWDQRALFLFNQYFKGSREVIPVDCRELIYQHGSLHCATMQIPKGFLNPSFLSVEASNL